MSDTGHTDDMRGDACLGEQWSDLVLVDAFALSPPAVRVDVDKQVFGSAGCRQQQTDSFNNHVCVSQCVCVGQCVCVSLSVVSVKTY